MKKETLDLLNTISSDELFKTHNFVLIGGTALSLHINHRLSEDLDFMFLGDKLPKNDIFIFIKKYEGIFEPFDTSIQNDIINDGGNIDDIQQRYIINGVKVDFVINTGHTILENDIITNENKEHYRNNIYIASIESIFKQKSLLAILDRNKIRDLFDLYTLVKDCRYNVKDIINVIIQYRITHTIDSIEDILLDKKQNLLDEQLDGLMNNPPTYNELIKFFLDEIKEIKKANILKL